MTMHVVWYTAMSMDGRIANPHQSLDFLSTIEGGDNAASDFQQFLSDIEAVLIGASTLRWLL